MDPLLIQNILLQYAFTFFLLSRYYGVFLRTTLHDVASVIPKRCCHWVQNAAQYI